MIQHELLPELRNDVGTLALLGSSGLNQKSGQVDAHHHESQYHFGQQAQPGGYADFDGPVLFFMRQLFTRRRAYQRHEEYTHQTHE